MGKEERMVLIGRSNWRDIQLCTVDLRVDGKSEL